MKIAFSEHLMKAYDSEEDLIHKINYVLNLFLAKSDLPQQKVDEIKSILKTSEESLKHKVTLEKIMAELEPHV